MSADKDNMRCQYCGVETEIVTGDYIYPTRPDLFHLNFYRCPQCYAYVGSHKNSKKPLGKVADAKLRTLRLKAHLAFDVLHKTKVMTRSSSYQWLANKMGINKKDCHIAQFSTNQCQQVILIMKERIV